MGYDRTYSREEIHQMLYQSERRARPDSVNGSAPSGHAISQHTEQREDIFDRPQLKKDSVFASRKSLVLAVEEALHSSVGQQKLATLNAHGTKSCTIVYELSLTRGKIKANAVLYPTAAVGNSIKRAQGPGHYVAGVQVSSVFLFLFKHSAAQSFAPLHVQTAYPQEVTLA
jgi:hypothetical protein